MKKIYICGDSFGVSDPAHGFCWVDLLRNKIDYEIINLCQVCASNLVISSQVDQTKDSDFTIVLFSASTRNQVRYRGQIVPYSIHSLDDTTPFDQKYLADLTEYSLKFFDLETSIYESQCIIESVLQRLVDRDKPFLFDQGGFEHPSYGSVKTYFDKYQQYRSRYNLWDYADNRSHRPYYHITDAKVHEMIADYYAEQIHKA